MSPIQTILAGIHNDDPESFLAASEILRARARGVDSGVFEPYASMYADNPLTDGQVESLKRALIDYMSTGRTKCAASAIVGLTELRDESVIPVLQQSLHERLWPFLIAGQSIGQLLCALRDYGEELNPISSYSFDDYTKHAVDARDYLIAQGFEDPRVE